MALRILDGNQSATTLSTILSGGEHTPAHTVVSLGPTAISNITSAVSGSVVSVSNFPASQTIAGTVTANNLIINDYFGSALEQVGADDATYAVRISGTVTANLGSPRFIYEDSEGQLGGKSVLIGTAGVEDGTVYAVSIDHPLPATIINSVTIGSLPTISGTVTVGNSVSVGNSITVGAIVGPIGGSVFKGVSGSVDAIRILPYFSQSGVGNYNEVSTSNPIPVSQQGAISGTVTVGAVPNGSLTTRFGTPTTASVAFATSAVTNASRKYLLVQNVTTGGNVITVGIGFTPTTTQGIQLAVGAGITFESSYIPTGAVYVLSSVTASNFTILEA